MSVLRAIFGGRIKLRTLLVLVSALLLFVIYHGDILSTTAVVLALALFIVDNFIIGRIIGDIT